MAIEGIKRLENFENFYKDTGLPTRLNEVNIPNDRFEEMAEKCVDRGPSGNFVKLNKRNIISIYKIAE
jgi:alcohol dehydrogenase YqhD (iron-dependent ADH family)